MNQFLYQVSEQIENARKNRHRLLVCIAGSRQWAEQQAWQLISHLSIQALWGGDGTSSDIPYTDFNACRRLLGDEVEALVFDAHSGFDPNIFALLSGTVCAGGPLIILTPELALWPKHPDPVNNRCCVWGQEVQYSRYLARLASLLPACSQVLYEYPGKLNILPNTVLRSSLSAVEEQHRLVKLIASDHNFADATINIISGDRGRGKSAALGQIAAELAAQQNIQIIISAPRKAAVQTLLTHAKKHWKNKAHLFEKQVLFVAPDRLVSERISCDVLLLDEMGGIHLSLLKKLLGLYPRLIMAGTIHGYEGAGRGFHTRLRTYIKTSYPNCHWHTLRLPIRWAENDPVELSCQRLLMLDAEAGATEESEASFSWLQRDLLMHDESLLRQVYGLLAAAHYRTRPLDLRQILDGPNIKLAVLRAKNHVIAACLIAQEGPIQDTELKQQILHSKRRPRGHLLPQLLLQRRQIEKAADLSFWRIVRIAVQPNLQNRGHGQQLISQVEHEASIANIDCIGSIFALDSLVLNFWAKCGFHPALLGDNLEATSGSYALTVYKPLSNCSKSVIATANAQWMSEQLPAVRSSHPALSANLVTQLGSISSSYHDT